MLRKYLEEMNENYEEFSQLTEEAIKRRKVVQQRNEEISKQNEEILKRLKALQKECLQLQKKSQALDGLEVQHRPPDVFKYLASSFFKAPCFGPCKMKRSRRM